MSRINNRNKPFFFGTLFSSILFTIISIREICIFIRDFSKIIANPYSLVFEIFMLIIILMIPILSWREYFIEKRNKKTGDDTPAE